MARTRVKLYGGKWTKEQVQERVEQRYGKLDSEFLKKILNMILTILPFLLPFIMGEGPMTAKEKKKLQSFEHLMGLTPAA